MKVKCDRCGAISDYNPGDDTKRPRKKCPACPRLIPVTGKKGELNIVPDSEGQVISNENSATGTNPIEEPHSPVTAPQSAEQNPEIDGQYAKEMAYQDDFSDQNMPPDATAGDKKDGYTGISQSSGQDVTPESAPPAATRENEIPEKDRKRIQEWFGGPENDMVVGQANLGMQEGWNKTTKCRQVQKYIKKGWIKELGDSKTPAFKTTGPDAGKIVGFVTQKDWPCKTYLLGDNWPRVKKVASPPAEPIYEPLFQRGKHGTVCYIYPMPGREEKFKKTRRGFTEFNSAMVNWEKGWTCITDAELNYFGFKNFKDPDFTIQMTDHLAKFFIPSEADDRNEIKKNQYKLAWDLFGRFAKIFHMSVIDELRTDFNAIFNDKRHSTIHPKQRTRFDKTPKDGLEGEEETVDFIARVLETELSSIESKLVNVEKSNQEIKNALEAQQKSFTDALGAQQKSFVDAMETQQKSFIEALGAQQKEILKIFQGGQEKAEIKPYRSYAGDYRGN